MIEMSISSGTAAALLSKFVIPNKTGVSIIIMTDNKSKGKKLCRRFTFAICQTCNVCFDFFISTQFAPPFLFINNYRGNNK